MAYSTVSDIRAATGMQDNTLISDAFITVKLNAADDLIDDKISDVYQLPLASTPDLIKQLSIELASAFLYMDQYGEQVNANGVDPKSKLVEATSILEDIRLQKTKLRDQSTGSELTRTTFLQPSGHPTSSSVDSGTAPIFSIDQQF